MVTYAKCVLDMDVSTLSSEDLDTLWWKEALCETAFWENSLFVAVLWYQEGLHPCETVTLRRLIGILSGHHV